MKLVERLGFALMTGIGLAYTIGGAVSYPSDEKAYERRRQDPSYTQQNNAVTANVALKTAYEELHPTPVTISESARENALGMFFYGIAKMAEDPSPNPRRARETLRTSEAGMYAPALSDLANAIKDNAQQNDALTPQFKDLQARIERESSQAYHSADKLEKEHQREQETMLIIALAGTAITILSAASWYANRK